DVRGTGRAGRRRRRHSADRRLDVRSAALPARDGRGPTGAAGQRRRRL
ncbi:MAG: hypothetical protein AVDCRST_MAG04-912, partial [uncultured Acetobacteraceae bacterium]